jgi:phage shock protein PspC (stress-responsive transcriptional regulator)
MNLLTDEILNEYLDSNLDEQKREEVEKLLASSENDRKRFNALKVIHDELSQLKEDKTSEDFTRHVISKLGKKFELPRQQKYFVFVISSIFIFICVGIVAYTVTTIISTSSPQSESIEVTETVHQLSNGLIHELKKIFSSKNLSLIGLIFSLGIMISGYFFFENQKRNKANLGT